MSILRKRKLKKYRTTIFLLCFFCAAGSVKAQENTEPDPKKQVARETIYSQSVLMGSQNPETVVQSVSTISGERLLHRPSHQMESTLDGVLPGLFISSGDGYASAQKNVQLRGRSLTILVDGIPRPDINIPAHQIESITVIKDALGLAMMGQVSGNGVLYIKTKRGQRTSMRIDFTAQLAFAQQMNTPKFLGAYPYSNLLNEALANDGLNPMFSDRDLNLFKTGDSPFTHPDVDWNKELNRKTVPIQQYNLNISGGGKSTRYFIDVNVFDQGGFLKQDKSLNSYDTREIFKKYSLRTNVDISLSENTLLKVNIFGQMFREITPGQANMSDFYKLMRSTPNNAYPKLNPNGTYAGNAIYPDNSLFGQSVGSGYRMYPKSDLNADLVLEHRFKNKLEGLFLSGTYSYNSSYIEALNRSKTFTTYSYWKDPENTNPDTDANYTILRTGGAQENKTDYSRVNRLQYIELAAGYDFNVDKHSSRTKVLYTYNDYLTMSKKLPVSRNAVSFRTEYDFDERYMAEFAMSAMNMNQLKSGEQWGIFPAAGLGWNIHKENFFSDVKAVNKLKLRATYGLNGNDGAGSFYRGSLATSRDNYFMEDYYYTYMKYYKSGTNPNLGGSPTSMPTFVEANLPYLTKWEKIKKLNIGIDFEAFDKTLSATVEFFHENHTDILQKAVAKDKNSIVGIGTPKEHIGAYRQNGVEIDLGYTNKFGDFTVFANANAVFYKTKLKANGEIEYPESYMQRVGQSRSRVFGHVAQGFFQSSEEIAEYLSTTTIEGYSPVVGDIKYQDINNDGIINGKDVTALGSDAPRIEFGLFLGAEWKGIALSMQWAGVANNYSTVKNTPFGINDKGGYGQALVEHLDRWSIDNPNARYPRLSATDNTYNTRTSSFWLENASYLRLKNIELSYSLPRKWTSAMRLSGVKVFVNAYNLLTITGIKDRDPEILSVMNSSNTPNIKAFNMGLNIKF